VADRVCRILKSETSLQLVPAMFSGQNMKWQTATTVVLALALFGGNPTQDEYVAWLKQQASKGNGVGGVLAALFGGAVFNASTTRLDYLLFSIYRTDLGSGLIDQSQKRTTAAMQMAEKNVWAHRS